MGVEPIQLAAVLATVVFVASVLSVELGVTVALLELALGVVVGNALHLDSAEWFDFVASFASIVLTFLAGMEVDPAFMRRRLGDLRQAEPLVPGLPRGLARARPLPAESRAVVLRSLRQSRDRAGDQARLPLPLCAHGPGRRLERARRPPGLRSR